MVGHDAAGCSAGATSAQLRRSPTRSSSGSKKALDRGPAPTVRATVSFGHSTPSERLSFFRSRRRGRVTTKSDCAPVTGTRKTGPERGNKRNKTEAGTRRGPYIRRGSWPGRGTRQVDVARVVQQQQQQKLKNGPDRWANGTKAHTTTGSSGSTVTKAHFSPAWHAATSSLGHCRLPSWSKWGGSRQNRGGGRKRRARGDPKSRLATFAQTARERRPPP